MTAPVSVRYEAIIKIADSQELRTLLDLLLQTQSHSREPDEKRKSDSHGAPIRRQPVVIVAGGTDRHSEKTLSGYRTLLIEAFHDFSGTLISGGTTAGICGLVAEAGEIYKKNIETIGYMPAILPKTERIDTRYREIRRTDGTRFSIKEPLYYWKDILASGIAPSEIKLLGINGGAVSAAEYRIALLLGAKVGIVEDSGRAATKLLKDPEWNTAGNLVILPADSATLRAFIGFGARIDKSNE